jgi:hypothetical protein
MGTTEERLEITQRRENIRARNYVSGPEILPQGQNFHPWTKFSRPSEIRLSPLQNIVVQRAVRGRKFWSGRISGGRKFHNFRPSKIWLSSFQRAVVQLSDKGPEILLRQNFRGPEILEFLAPAIFR